MKAICMKDCWDSEKCMLYLRGRVYEIDESSTVARHFTLDENEKLPEEIKMDMLRVTLNKDNVIAAELRRAAEQEAIKMAAQADVAIESAADPDGFVRA